MSSSRSTLGTVIISFVLAGAILVSYVGISGRFTAQSGQSCQIGGNYNGTATGSSYNYTLSGNGQVDFLVTQLSGPFTLTPPPPSGYTSVSSDVTLTNANGTITVHLSATAMAVSPDGSMSGPITATLTGGTGNYAGYTGSIPGFFSMNINNQFILSFAQCAGGGGGGGTSSSTSSPVSCNSYGINPQQHCDANGCTDCNTCYNGYCNCHVYYCFKMANGTVTQGNMSLNPPSVGSRIYAIGEQFPGYPGSSILGGPYTNNTDALACGSNTATVNPICVNSSSSSAGNSSSASYCAACSTDCVADPTSTACGLCVQNTCGPGSICIPRSSSSSSSSSRSSSSSSSSSSSAICGNAKVEGPESCDDGNWTPGDCCSAQCQVEPGCMCSNNSSSSASSCGAVCTISCSGGPQTASCLSCMASHCGSSSSSSVTQAASANVQCSCLATGNPRATNHYSCTINLSTTNAYTASNGHAKITLASGLGITDFEQEKPLMPGNIVPTKSTGWDRVDWTPFTLAPSAAVSATYRVDSFQDLSTTQNPIQFSYTWTDTSGAQSSVFAVNLPACGSSSSSSSPLACTDSDNGDVRDVVGTTVDPVAGTFYDYCSDSGTASGIPITPQDSPNQTEFYCSNGHVVQTGGCMNGTICVNGACMQPSGRAAAESVCKDSDGGVNVLVEGSVTVGGQTYQDSCAALNAPFVNEEYCSGNTHYTLVMTCPGGLSICLNGRCQ